mgnify:CR=1 FL=1
MPIIQPQPVEKAYLPNIVISQSVSGSSRGSTMYPWIAYAKDKELKELSENEKCFLSSIDMLYNFWSKKNLSEYTKDKVIELMDHLHAACFYSPCELEHRIELLNIIKGKIEKLPNSEKKDYANRMFSLFLLDYQARLNLKNKKYIEAARDLFDLMCYAKNFAPYYEPRKNGWVEHYYYACYILYLKSSGVSDLDLINNSNYKSIDCYIKDYFALNYPEFKALRDLEKSQKSQVRPRESEESEGSRDAKRKRVEDTAEKS